VLPLFEEFSSNDRSRQAIETARAWARGELPVGAAQKAAVAAHAAARDTPNQSATAAACAAGHAAATAHMADHALGAALYALKAIEATGAAAAAERAWQIKRLPAEGRDSVVSALQSERFKAAVGSQAFQSRYCRCLESPVLV